MANSRQMSNMDQDRDTGMMPHDLRQQANQAGSSDHPSGADRGRDSSASDPSSANSPALTAENAETLERGGYGGEQEYESMDSASGGVRHASQRYANQTDMTDETGDTSRSDASTLGQGQLGDEGITPDTHQGGI